MYLKKIRLVTFDITHTLLKFSLSPGQQYGKVAEKYGVTISVEPIAQNFNTHFKEMSARFPNFGKESNITWEEWWRIVVRKTFKPYVSDKLIVESIASDLIESYKSKNCWMLNDGCKDILNFFENCDVVLGVISNFDPRLIEILKNVKIHHYFNFILTSYEAGAMKPSATIFNEALKKSNVFQIHPCEALHIGDNIDLDYFGARLAGWEAAIINNKLSSPEISQIHKNVQSNSIFCNLFKLQQYFYKNKEIFE